MKFLILGCNGMAGHTISLYLKEKGYDVTGFARSDLKLVKTIIGDAREQAKLVEIIKNGNYGYIVNCIGILNEYAERNKSEAILLNSYLPHLLENITDKMKTQVIHISTDCVFSGKRGQYAESDLPDGETFYDRSKALGEIENGKDFTIRTSIIGPDMNPEGIGLLNWFLQQKGNVQGYTRAVWTGITTLQLAKIVEQTAKKKAHGLYNLVPEKEISKYDLLVLCKKYLRNDDIQIKKSEYPVIDKSLKRTRFEYKFHVPDYETMIMELGKWMQEHRKLYTQYVNTLY